MASFIADSDMQKTFHPEEFVLSNGIPVIMQHSEGPVAATYWWINTGSVNERAPQEAGFAHFLEHMLFKDASAKETGRASTGQMARMVESLGGDINAYTSFDQTVYHVTCAAHHWEKILDAFGPMAKPQKFLKQDFEREREVILEELRKNEDSPGRQLFQGLFAATFMKHPYGRPVIGFAKTLKAAKLAELEKFYRRHYVSENMGLILVGPIEDESGARKKRLKNLLEKYYGKAVIKRQARPVTKPTQEPAERRQATWKTQSFDVKTPSFTVSFRVPELSHEDIPALDLLAGVLGMGELSRLYQSLFYQHAVVTDVSGGLYVPREPGMIYFQAEMDSIEKLNSVAEQLFSELKRIQKEGPSPEEMARVIVSAESERYYATQSADGVAGRIGFLKFIMGDLSFDDLYLNRLRELTAADIQKVAERYLHIHRMSGVVLLPKGIEYDLSPIEKKANEILAPVAQERRSARKQESVKKEMESFVLKNGIRVHYYPRPSSHVMSVHASVLGGLRLEIAHPVESATADWGSSYLLSHVWTKGTSKLNAREIAAAMEGRAASMDGFSGRNSIGLQLTGLARDWEPLSELFSEVFLQPSFPQDEVDHAKRIVEDSIRSIEDHTSQLCSKLFIETLFEKHPYGRIIYGSLDSLQKIHSEKLSAFHQQWIRPERMVLSVAGKIKRPDLERWLNAFEERMTASSSSLDFVPFEKLDDEPQLKGPRWVEKPLGREQLHLLVGGLGTRIGDEDRFANRILQNVLSGQSGRLFVELREKKSLAYTVAPVSFEGLERGYLGTYMACAPQKREEGLAGIRAVLEKLAEKGPTAAEMKRAKEFYLGRRAMDLQSDSALAAHYGLETLYGVPHLTEQELIKRISAITPRHVQEICRKYWVEPYFVTSVVG